jgi:DNA-directed RNA polymerase specialized sigma24 family protein
MLRQAYKARWTSVLEERAAAAAMFQTTATCDGLTIADLAQQLGLRESLVMSWARRGLRVFEMRALGQRTKQQHTVPQDQFLVEQGLYDGIPSDEGALVRWFNR